MKTKETSPFKDFLDKKEISGESTREQALAWWNSLISEEVQYYMERYFYNNKLPFVSKLTYREIEEIWKKEIQIPELRNAEHNVEYLENSNQKQFKQFNESLHKAYLNKFSEEDKFKAFISNLNELSKETQFNAFLATLKKMNLDSQTQSNIMTLVALRDI